MYTISIAALYNNKFKAHELLTQFQNKWVFPWL